MKGARKHVLVVAKKSLSETPSAGTVIATAGSTCVQVVSPTTIVFLFTAQQHAAGGMSGSAALYHTRRLPYGDESEEDHLSRLLCPRGRLELPREAYNEVYPGVLLGDGATALCVGLLRRLGVTHVLNAACGREPRYCLVNTGPALYRAAGIAFLGIEALDVSAFRLDRYFDQAADFIERALAEPGGRVLVHCHQGISRSATLVLAFLMLRRKLSAAEAVRLVRGRREIVPNRGFLRQLCLLERQLRA